MMCTYSIDKFCKQIWYVKHCQTLSKERDSAREYGVIPTLINKLTKNSNDDAFNLSLI